MEYRTLGKTGLRVSVLGFGGSPFGAVYGNAISHDEAAALVREALDLGVNYFDVSPFYGLTKAESVLGAALRGIERDRYILSTKVGRYGADEFDFSAARVTQSLDESMARLGVSYVDIVICHDIEFGDLDQIINETIPALKLLKEQGRLGFIGVSGLPLKIFSYILDHAPGAIDVVLSYCHTTLYDSTLEHLIPRLREQGIGIINASPLGMGLLTNASSPPDWHPAPAELKAACKEAGQLCERNGANLASIAVQYSVGFDVDTTLVGIQDSQQLRSNVDTVIRRAELTTVHADLLKQIKAIFEPVQGTTWPSGRSINN